MKKKSCIYKKQIDWITYIFLPPVFLFFFFFMKRSKALPKKRVKESKFHTSCRNWKSQN